MTKITTRLFDIVCDIVCEELNQDGDKRLMSKIRDIQTILHAKGMIKGRKADDIKKRAA